MAKRPIKRDEKIALKLTQAERTLLLDGLRCLPPEYERRLRSTVGEPVMLPPDELDDLAGYVAAASNHATDSKVQKKLDGIFLKIQRLLKAHTDEEPTRQLKIMDGGKKAQLADQTAALTEYVTNALVAAEKLGIKDRPVVPFPLADAERVILSLLPSVSPKLKRRLATGSGVFTIAEIAGITTTVAESLADGEPMQLFVLLMIAKKLADSLKADVVEPTKPTQAKKPKTTDLVYQFKITLLDTAPPIWRRIQVKDCTLDKLHEHIQTAMGWTNSHLHHFRLGKQLYGDPELMQENFEDLKYKDSTTTNISAIVPKTGKRFRFEYEYDFGDSWHHEVLFEGCVPVVSGKKYPLCVEGQRACPPEDVGGIGGYEDFLEAIADRRHERHEELLGWIGGKFDSEGFDATKATTRMKKGLPDWRKEERWI